jgi:hypothetical protein
MPIRAISNNSSTATFRPARANAVAAVIALACGVIGPFAEAAPPYAGRLVEEVVREIAREAELQLVYNTQLLTADARVAREPPAGSPLNTLAAVLAPLGLRLQAVNHDTYAIARAQQTAGSQETTAPATEPLTEVIVTASRYSLAADVPDVQTSLTQTEIDALPRLADDVLKTVHRLPGAASNGLSGLAHLRGGDTNETIILFDGLALYEPFHLRLLQGPASVLDERVVGGLDVYAGGFTAEYGDRMSAVIDARSVRPELDAYYEVGLSLLHTNALAAHSFAEGRGQWLAAVRRSNLHEVSDIFDSDLGEPTYVDGFLRVDYDWTPSTRGSVHALLARDEADVNSTDDTEHSDVSYSNSYVWATLDHAWSGQFRSRALFSYTDIDTNRDATVIDPGRRNGVVADDRKYHVAGLKLDTQYAAQRWLHRAGIDVRSLSARYDYSSAVVFAPDYPVPGAPGLARVIAVSPAPSGEHVALYYTLRARLTEALTAEAGLRWDEQTYGPDGDDQLGPRLNLAWQMDARTRLLASWGRFQQFQGIEELQVEEGSEEFLPAQRADHTILALEREVGAAWALRAEVYHKNYRRLQPRHESLYDPLSLAPELRWDRVQIAPQSAEAEGAELLLTRKAADPWSGWLGLAWSQTTDRIGGDNVRRSWDQTRTFNGGIGWTRDGWQATIAAQYHTGWPVTPLQLNASATEVVLGPRNGERYADYATLDFRASREWQLRRGTLTVHAEATNALDRRNPCCTDFEFPVDANGTISIDSELRHWLPLVPSLGVLWKF